MSEAAPSGDPDRRRQELEAELARLDEDKRQEAEKARQAEQAEREAKLTPELRAEKAELERRADEALDRQYPPAWLPQKDKAHPERIVGLVLRIDPKVGPSPTYGTYSAVVEVQATDAKEWTIWMNYGSALYEQLLRLRIQPGELIGLKYKGKKPSQRNPGQDYHDFKLARVTEHDEPAPEIDYDELKRAQQPRELPPGDTGSQTEGETPPPDDDIPF
jgi:hypothetical protein